MALRHSLVRGAAVLALAGATTASGAALAAGPGGPGAPLGLRAPSRTLPRLAGPMMPARGHLGFAPLAISAATRQALGAPADRGVLVDDVVDGSPARRSGLEPGDVVTMVDGKPVTDRDDILDAIAGHKAHDVIEIRTFRNRIPFVRWAELDGDVPVASLDDLRGRGGPGLPDGGFDPRGLLGRGPATAAPDWPDALMPDLPPELREQLDAMRRDLGVPDLGRRGARRAPGPAPSARPAPDPAPGHDAGAHDDDDGGPVIKL